MATDEKKTKKSDSTRRRLLIGLAGTPIMASLPSRSAWGQECSISGMLSGNLSNHLHECRTLGDGKTPEYWKTHPACWPADTSMTLEFGTMYKPPARKKLDPCKECDAQGRVLSDNTYTYENGTTLDSVISQVLSTSGSSLIWTGGFTLPIMGYLLGSDAYAQQACAALLNALHSGVTYPYSPREIAEVLVTVNGDVTKEIQLEGVLAHFNANYAESAALMQRCTI
ncbi:hypothetical protein [Marinobacterium rhizophilum]|uniref:hypothetical protein n=1 Tax=Marinobacterium rhizophilum TaxID=420402 RepID=UPI0004773192|nr:hypothetical protein [Marinobacterium rhizophilum]